MRRLRRAAARLGVLGEHAVLHQRRSRSVEEEVRAYQRIGGGYVVADNRVADVGVAVFHQYAGRRIGGVGKVVGDGAGVDNGLGPAGNDYHAVAGRGLLPILVAGSAADELVADDQAALDDIGALGSVEFDDRRILVGRGSGAVGAEYAVSDFDRTAVRLGRQPATLAVKGRRRHHEVPRDAIRHKERVLDDYARTVSTVNAEPRGDPGRVAVAKVGEGTSCTRISP